MVQIVISSAGAGGLAEWVLMELQGEIEARYSTGLAGNLLGDLHYTTEVRGPFFPCLMPQESKLHQGGAPRTQSEDCPQERNFTHCFSLFHYLPGKMLSLEEASVDF
ncbi:chromosome transmission fidelity protein 8 homolog isoform X2 [Canis lupus baileyi]|uniref:chromosome transmission fidelity protein 8 homolog isoform X2 n=1 Tax=Canis lupus baileyi TaxID=143281 RepID=UPI000BAA0A49|eukprot:XP_022274986.1 chromosome transmission fidelity protein 8 homolog isoform X3 [Canis lupus familiaris]